MWPTLAHHSQMLTMVLFYSHNSEHTYFSPTSRYTEIAHFAQHILLHTMHGHTHNGTCIQ